MRTKLVRGVAFAIVLFSSSPGAAQTLSSPAPRRIRGIFGAPSTRDQTFDLGIQTFGAYDDNLIADGGSPDDPRIQTSGSYAGLAANGTYAGKGRHTDIEASGRSMLRYYPALGDIGPA